MTPLFKGRIFQVVDSLDYGDAVSNQVIQMGEMFKRMGFSTAIHANAYHEKVRELGSDLEEMQPADQDIVILHYAGHSVWALPYVQKIRCTKICVYHNITPHTFFPKNTSLYEFCLKGREQLAEIVQEFHYFWGDSAYNLNELKDLGVAASKCAVIPIIVNNKNLVENKPELREQGAWMFLGRIAANKAHVKLVQLFSNVRKKNTSIAQRLYLVGGFQPSDPYYQELKSVIKRLGLLDYVTITGKISDDEVAQYLANASVYVSMSEHEGFGVPLIEAANHDLPVAALATSAVGETMGNGPGLADTANQLEDIIQKILSEPDFRRQVTKYQKDNAARFTYPAVEEKLATALKVVLPQQDTFTKVSIVICTYSRKDFLERCLDYLQYQTNQNFEVVVINGPSDDGTDEVLETYRDRIKIGHNSQRNLSISRNMGIELSDGEIIAFIDDDALPFDDWVDTIIAEFSRQPLTMAALGGPVHNAGTNTCFRADFLRAVGGFDEQFDYFSDESELCLRLQKKGHIVGYCPDLSLGHDFAPSHKHKNDVEAISDGAMQGPSDASNFPKIRQLNAAPNAFRAFCLAASAPLAGRNQKRLHICIVTKEFPAFAAGGDIGTLYYHLASELLLMGHRVTVVVPGNNTPSYQRGRFTVRYADSHAIYSDTLGCNGFTTNTNWSLSALHAVAALHAENPVDVIDSSLRDSEALAIALIAPEKRPPLVIRLVTPFPVAARMNGWSVAEREDSLLRAAEKSLIMNADAVVPMSESIASTIENEYGISRDFRWKQSHCGIAYWPLFDSRFKHTELDAINGKPLSVPADARILLFAGRLESRKGVDVLLAAANDFLASDPKAHLLLAGRDVEGWAQRAQNILNEQAINRVHFLGEVDDTTRQKLLHSAYCVLVPSRYESFGLVMLEAFVHGTPVVASRSGAIPEVVEDNSCGLLFEPEDSKTLADCVIRLLADSDLQQRLSRGAKSQARKFSSRRSAIHAVKLYLTLPLKAATVGNA